MLWLVVSARRASSVKSLSANQGRSAACGLERARVHCRAQLRGAGRGAGKPADCSPWCVCMRSQRVFPQLGLEGWTGLSEGLSPSMPVKMRGSPASSAREARTSMASEVVCEVVQSDRVRPWGAIAARIQNSLVTPRPQHSDTKDIQAAVSLDDWRRGGHRVGLSAGSAQSPETAGALAGDRGDRPQRCRRRRRPAASALGCGTRAQ